MDHEPARAFAERLSLRYVDDAAEGHTRRRRGRGFSYHAADGALLRGAERDRCVALAIPPAWEEVWICAWPEGHLQARGQDDAGRPQYRYHERWTAGRRLANFDRLTDIGGRLGPLRRRLEQLLSDRTDPVVRATAAMVRLADEGLARIGGPRSVRTFGHHGVSTLTTEHVAVDGDHIDLRYPAKGGVEREVEIADRRLADVIAHLETASDQLFVLRNGGEHRLSAADANELLAELTNGRMTCKDFRTWGGSACALAARVEGADEVRAVDAAAEALGNTRAVARTSYVHPDVLATDPAVLADAWRRSRSSIRFDRRESALLKLLRERPPLLGRWLDGDLDP